jgi:biotin carboxyl carrier protein
MTKNSNEGEKSEYQTLVINDTRYKTLFTQKFENRKPWVRPDDRKIFSILPGTILKINIKKGDTVKEGQELLVFEAMKMLNSMKATQEGVIKDIYINMGDKIPKNFLMLEFE